MERPMVVNNAEFKALNLARDIRWYLALQAAQRGWTVSFGKPEPKVIVITK